MKKLLLLFFFLFLISFVVKSQKEDYVWRVGYKGGIDFNKGYADTFAFGKQISLCYANSSTCDSAGNFLFFTNGSSIFNSNGDTLLNGKNLSPGRFSSAWSWSGLPIFGSQIIIQRPNHPEEYYLFHETYDNDSAFISSGYLCNVLYQTVIDMSLDSGRGGVTSIKNYHLYDKDTLQKGKLAVVRHANGRDWWIITKKQLSPTFYKWLVEPDTIKGPFVQSNQPASIAIIDDGIGQACFSPQGDKYAVAYNNRTFYLYDFDRCTGNLTYIFKANFNDSSLFGACGCAFSLSGRYLYVTTTNYTYQYDLWSANIPASKSIVAVYDGLYSPFQTFFGDMKLAPDGKIYIATLNGCTVMHVIEYPDSGGFHCNLRQHSFSPPTTNMISVPNIPDYKIGAIEGPCDTILTGNTNLLQNEKRITIYPNPLTSSSTLQLYTQVKNAEVVIYDMLGKEMLRKKLTGNRMEIERGSLESGVYFVRVVSEERQSAGGRIRWGEWVEKIIVQ